MTVVIEPTVQTSEHWSKQQTGALAGRDFDELKREAARLNRPQDTASQTRRAMVYSAHTHYDPLQVAIEDGLEAWARHAAASNGFGDLP